MTATAAENGEKVAVVVGAGLVGALAAVYMAKRGYRVEVYEKRADVRAEPMYEGRSINLALSTRGITALKHVGLDQEVVSEGLPMYGRMIHDLSGKTSLQPYGLHGEAILSVHRRQLNEALLNAAERVANNVTLFFNHQLVDMDLDAKTLTFSRPDHTTVTKKADIIIGADGAHSVARKRLMSKVRMNYRQEYIGHGYKELTIYPSEDGDFRMDNKSLHIWPRHTFMMIALPNQDRTFTVTLFAPYEKFEELKTEDQVRNFFTTYFPDALQLIGEEALLRDYFKNPTGNLMSVKCTPYHYKDALVIVGDAAHAMVPFYGQGMNAGFEDLYELDMLLNKYGDDIETALSEYSVTRNPNAEAICDLAVGNYLEMRSKVVDPIYRMQRFAAGVLHHLAPSTFIPLYSMVAFTRIPYSRVMPLWHRQLRIINVSATVLATSFISGAALALIHIFKPNWNFHGFIAHCRR